ncbi:cobalamin-binding protein [Priestia megaterium]|nr:cobalamin-binding protein [Priestia megaterium]
MRVVSLCPSNTELVGYLKCEHLLVGVDDYSDWPASIEALPRLGPDLSIDMDLVAELKPDLVIASLSVPGMEKNIEALKERNLPYIILNPNSLEDIRNDLLELGKRLNVEKYARDVAARYDALIKDYREISSTIEQKPTLYWEWWPKPIFTPGKTNWLTEISELAGGKNLFSDLDTASVQTDWEYVKTRQPDHICLAWVGVQTKKVNKKVVEKRVGWEELSIADNHIHILEEWLYCRPSPRLLVGLQKLASLIHPDRFPMYDKKDPLL